MFAAVEAREKYCKGIAAGTEGSSYKLQPTLDSTLFQKSIEKRSLSCDPRADVDSKDEFPPCFSDSRSGWLSSDINAKHLLRLKTVSPYIRLPPKPGKQRLAAAYIELTHETPIVAKCQQLIPPHGAASAFPPPSLTPVSRPPFFTLGGGERKDSSELTWYVRLLETTPHPTTKTITRSRHFPSTGWNGYVNAAGSAPFPPHQAVG